MSARRILIVDDEADIREIARLSLERVAGWDVREAATGAEALVSAEADPPDAILLDVMMPDLDGPTTLERLRALAATRAVPVLFLTAKAQPGEVRRLQSLGAQAVIRKPFDPMTLHRQVAAALGWDARR